jgi:hypothetical protein
MEARDNQQAFQVSDSVVELPCRVITDASTSEILVSWETDYVLRFGQRKGRRLVDVMIVVIV